MRAELVQRKLGQQRGRLGPAPLCCPGGRHPGRDGRHLGTADSQPAAVEGPAERHRHRLAAEPRRNKQRALMGQDVQGPGGCLGIGAGVDDQRHLFLLQLLWGDGGDAEATRQVTTPRLRLRAQRPPSGALQQQCRQQPDGTGPENHHAIGIPGAGVECYLQGRLDQREQGAGRRADGRQRDQVTGRDRERVLVRVEGEH